MKYTYLIFLIFVLSCTTKVKEDGKLQPTSEIQFDSVMAADLGADDYGMRQYVMAFLKSGPKQSEDSATRYKLQRAHLDNINRLAEEGKLILAGPFLDNGDLRGIYIFDVKDVKEAENLTKSDPAIQAGTLIMEFHPWYGSAGLRKINEIHQKIAKINI